MDWLARREHSAAELRRKLATRGFDADEIETAVAGLERDGLVSDARFAEAFAGSRRRRGQGPMRIRGELAARQIDPGLAAAELDEVDWVAAARTALGKRFGEAPPEDGAAWLRRARFLERRGFTAEQIRQALGRRPTD